MRRGAIKIMALLMFMLGSLGYIIILAALNGILGTLLSMGVTVFGALAIAKLIGGSIALSYGWIAFICVSCGVVRGLLRYLEQYSNHYIAFKSLAIVRDKIFKALRIFSPARLEGKQKGNIISMISADIETLEIFYAHTISPMVIALGVSVAVVVFVGLYASWYIALVAVISYIIVGVVLPPIFYKTMQGTGATYRTELADFNSYLLDSVKGNSEIVLGQNGKHRKAQIERRSDSMLMHMDRLNKKNSVATSITQTIVVLCHIAAIVVAGVLVYSGKADFGTLLVAVVAIMSSFSPVIALSALPVNLAQTFASGNRVLDLLAEKPQTLPITTGTDFVFEGVSVGELSFGYDDKTKVLDKFEFGIRKGQIVSIVGASGCGKSTFLKLLMRFWAKDGGYINYGNSEIETINTSSLLDNVTMVSQNTYLFDDTIGQNLTIAKPNATTQELETACRQASIYDFVMSLPNGFDTKVGELGGRLSSGERQRIGLARAFLRGSPLILLDEPTSNVDSINEGVILQALKDSKQGRSIIIVSHRESTARIADIKITMSA